MLISCPYCGCALPAHGEVCRVPVELDRVERVFHRLSRDRINETLQNSLSRHLEAFGRPSEA